MLIMPTKKKWKKITLYRCLCIGAWMCMNVWYIFFFSRSLRVWRSERESNVLHERLYIYTCMHFVSSCHWLGCSHTTYVYTYLILVCDLFSFIYTNAHRKQAYFTENYFIYWYSRAGSCIITRPISNADFMSHFLPIKFTSLSRIPSFRFFVSIHFFRWAVGTTTECCDHG